MTATPLGPFETEQQARMAALAAPDPMLIRACEAAGVTLGAYDERILAWLSGWELSTCAVVAGLVARAYAAGLMAVRQDGSDEGSGE